MPQDVSFPVSVGPFALTQVDFVNDMNAFYRVYEGEGVTRPDPGSDENIMSGWDFSERWGIEDIVFAQLSPLFRITLDDESKQAANIPLTADFFAWAYPVVMEDPVPEDASPEEKGFLTLGGYVYFNATSEAVGMRAITPIDVGSLGLSFGRPQNLPDRVAESLTQKGRFQEVTLPALASRGATHFAWIRPEEFADSVVSANGCFAYKFKDGMPTKYYPVVNEPVFTRPIVDEELDGTEVWTVLRVNVPPTLDKLGVFTKGPDTTIADLSNSSAEAADMFASQDLMSRLKIYLENKPDTVLSFDEWKASNEESSISNPWVFELNTQ